MAMKVIHRLDPIDNSKLLGLKINKASTSASGISVSDKMKNAIKALDAANESNNEQKMIKMMEMINNAEQSHEEILNMLDRMNDLAESSKKNDDQKTLTNEERESLNIEMESVSDEVERVSKKSEFNTLILFKDNTKIEENSNDYVKVEDTEVTITAIDSPNGTIKVGESTIPSNLENVSNPSAYSIIQQMQINRNLNNVASELNYNGPTIVTEPANETLEKMIIKYNFNDDEINLLKLKVKEILGNNDLNGTDLPKKVETSCTDCSKFRSYNELNQDKQFFSSKVLLLENLSKENVRIQVSKLTKSLIKTNDVKVKPLVKDLDLEEFKPKRKLMFLSKREINILANSLKYNKQDFENIALKLRIKHHRITDFAPVYKNGIYVRFAKWNEKLANDEYFATKPLKVIIF